MGNTRDTDRALELLQESTPTRMLLDKLQSELAAKDREIERLKKSLEERETQGE